RLIGERRGAPFSFDRPPFTIGNKTPRGAGTPPHRTATGAYLVSEVLGARSMIFVKDEDGLFTADPKKDRHAKFIQRITVSELEQLNLKDLVVERAVLAFMRNAEHRRTIQVINGMVKGNLTRALEGEPVGTVISAE